MNTLLMIFAAAMLAVDAMLFLSLFEWWLTRFDLRRAWNALRFSPLRYYILLLPVIAGCGGRFDVESNAAWHGTIDSVPVADSGSHSYRVPSADPPIVAGFRLNRHGDVVIPLYPNNDTVIAIPFLRVRYHSWRRDGGWFIADGDDTLIVDGR